MIPASPSQGIRVTSGEFDVGRLIATPVQVLQAAMRLHESVGLGGFVLCLMDAYTGARWSELVGQQSHEYNVSVATSAFRVRCRRSAARCSGAASMPMTARSSPRFQHVVAAGHAARGTRRDGTKTPAGTCLVELPPSIAVLYEELLDNHRHPFMLCMPEGKPWRRSNFRQCLLATGVGRPLVHLPRGPTFPRDGARGERGAGGGQASATGAENEGDRVYDHVTPAMRRMVLNVLETRWLGSLAALAPTEQARLVSWFPHLRVVLDDLRIATTPQLIPASSPHDH
jgi:hypothetical protein